MIFASLCLFRNDVLTPIPINSDVEFVDFDLTYTCDRRSQMILKRIGNQPKKQVQQPIISDPSYCWNACLIDAGNLPNDTTRKIGDFRAADIYLWEPAEQVPFYFNDAGNLPGEGITQRHGGTQWGSIVTGVDWGGRGLIGRIGGSAEFMSWKTFVTMSNESVRPLNVPVIPPNSPNNYLWIGPAYGK